MRWLGASPLRALKQRRLEAAPLHTHSRSPPAIGPRHAPAGSLWPKTSLSVNDTSSYAPARHERCPGGRRPRRLLGQHPAHHARFRGRDNRVCARQPPRACPCRPPGDEVAACGGRAPSERALGPGRPPPACSLQVHAARPHACLAHACRGWPRRRAARASGGSGSSRDRTLSIERPPRLARGAQV